VTDDDGIRIIASNSEAELGARLALGDLSFNLRELAANMLRVVRGAGRPENLGRQMAEVVALYARYRDQAGAYPSNYDIHQAISLRSEGNARKHTDKWSHAIDDIVQGSLQIAASQLLGQSTQEAAGESELMEGVARIEAIREANRLEALERRRSELAFSKSKSGAKRKPVRPRGE